MEEKYKIQKSPYEKGWKCTFIKFLRIFLKYFEIFNDIGQLKSPGDEIHQSQQFGCRRQFLKYWRRQSTTVYFCSGFQNG